MLCFGRAGDCADVKADMRIVIIGAGVAGLSIGWRLLQAGAQVTILERAQAGSGATWAAAGMIALAAELESSPPVEVDFAQKSNSLWPDFAKEVEAVSGRSLGYVRSGALLLGTDAAAMASRAAADPDLAFLTRETILARWPMLTGEYAGGLWAVNEAHVDNRALGRALAIAFIKAGGVLRPAEAAVNLTQRDGRVTGVATPFHHYYGDAVLLAAGAWSGQLVDVPVTPVKGEMIALAPPRDEAFDFAGPVVWGPGVYLVPRASGHGPDGQEGGSRLLVGATMEEQGFDTSLSQTVQQQLRGKAVALMPALARWSLVEHWAGLRPRSPDRLPLLGPSATPGLFIASGQFRNGILFTPAIAALMTDIVLGKAEPIPAFDPRRFDKSGPQT